ncbi:unnamed protein product [Cochlearia groenlandica]
MKFLICLVVLFLLMNDITANKLENSLIQEFCKNSSEDSTPNRKKGPETYNFCITTIKENPESHKVKNVSEVTIIAIENAMRNMTNVKGVIEKILKEKRYESELSAKLLRRCLTLYSDGNNLLTEAIRHIKLHNSKNAFRPLIRSERLSKACEMEFNEENKQISPVTKETEVLFEMLDIPTSFVRRLYLQS